MPFLAGYKCLVQHSLTKFVQLSNQSFITLSFAQAVCGACVVGDNKLRRASCL